MNSLFTFLGITILSVSSFTTSLNKVDLAHTAPSATTINFDAISENEVKNYYSSLKEGEKGEELLTDLQNILKVDQLKVNYNTGYIDGYNNSKNWYGYYLYERNRDLSPLTDEEITDKKYKTSDIWLNVMYLDSPIYIEKSINSGNYKYYPNYPDTTIVKEGTFSSSIGFDREHVFPKSFGFNGKNDLYKDLTAGCDAHNLHAGDRKGNQEGHNNLPYGNVVNKNDDKTEVITSTITGEVVGYVGKGKNGNDVFEPNDKDKGDIARSIFYMAARYHYYEDLGNGDETPALALGNDIDKVSTLEPSETIDNPTPYGELDDLLERNIIDPVSEYEIHRNDLIYNNIQNNRNPFIDYPDWANACFAPETSSGISFSNFNGGNALGYTLTLSLKDESKTNYYFLDKFYTDNFVTTLTNADNEIEAPRNVTFYINGKRINDGDSLLAFGNKQIYAVATTNSGYNITSNNIEIKISFSTVQVIIIICAIIVILIIIIAIYHNLSKKNKRKVKKEIKKKIKNKIKN